MTKKNYTIYMCLRSFMVLIKRVHPDGEKLLAILYDKGMFYSWLEKHHKHITTVYYDREIAFQNLLLTTIDYLSEEAREVLNIHAEVMTADIKTEITRKPAVSI